MTIAPAGYVPPPFPSLTFPLAPTDQVLYLKDDVLSFTILWTLIFFSFAYGAVGAWAAFVLRRKAKAVLVFAFFVVWGVATGAISGGVVGIILFRVYDAGNFPMPTWAPFVWGLIQVLIALMGGFSQTALTSL